MITFFRIPVHTGPIQVRLFYYLISIYPIPRSLSNENSLTNIEWKLMAISLVPFMGKIKRARTSYRIKRNLLDSIVTYYRVCECADTNLRGVNFGHCCNACRSLPMNIFHHGKAVANHINGMWEPWLEWNILHIYTRTITMSFWFIYDCGNLI